MKKSLLLLLLLPCFAFAQQDSAVITHYKDGKENERYTLNSEGMKNGAYTRLTRNGKVYIKGQYKNGDPVGIWEFFASDTTGDIVQKLDFDSHKELYVDSLRQHQIICGPRFFGGNMLKQEYAENHIKRDFSADEQKLYAGQRYTVSFVIDTTSLKPISGSVIVNEKDVSPAISEKIIKAVQDMPAWLPPVCHGDGEVWRFSVTFVF